jgi:hypothetical protein
VLDTATLSHSMHPLAEHLISSKKALIRPTAKTHVHRLFCTSRFTSPENTSDDGWWSGAF